jgi:hypothetical protein
MDELNDVQQLILTLIQQFVERQSIVLEAMKDLYFDPGMWLDETPRSWSILSRQYSLKSPMGIWIKDSVIWKYRLHGPGCDLVNQETGEPVQWDAPNLRRFDRYWFFNWIYWWIEQNQDQAVFTTMTVADRKTESFRTYIFKELYQLETLGTIVRDDPYPVRYILKLIT